MVQSYRQDLEATLATIHDGNGIVWFRGYRSYPKALKCDFRIGDCERDGNWLWQGQLTDTPVTITDWALDEPNNVDRDEDIW